MAPIVLVLVILLLIFVYYRVKFNRKINLFAKIPSPPKTFLLHNTPQMLGLSTTKLLEKITTWHQELGDVFHIKLHTFDDGMIVVADTKIAEALSLHQPDRNRAKIYRPLSRWIGKNGFFLSKGEQLKARLKVISQVINQKMHERYCRIVNGQMRRIIESGIACGDKVEIFTFARAVALDFIFEIIMGVELKSVYGMNKPYVDAIEEISIIATLAAVDPMSRYDLLHPFTSLYRREKKVLKILHDFTRKIVQDRRKELELNSENHEEFLMLNHYIQTPIDGIYLTDEEIREEIDTIILGGHDTTKSAFTFFMYCLAKYPEVQQRVYEEASDLMGDNINRDLNEKDLIKMPYLEAVIKETLRLYPSIPFVSRKLDSEITAGGYTFPKDADIFISPFLAGRNPKYFDDPLVFNPDRFYGVTGPVAGYIPFSIGARKCIGGGVTQLILKIVMIKAVLTYNISLVKGSKDLTLSVDVTLGPEDGIYLNMQKRNTINTIVF